MEKTRDGKALAAAETAAEKGIRVFVVGIGKQEGAPIPQPQGGFKKDRSGNVVITKLDEESLEKSPSKPEGCMYDLPPETWAWIVFTIAASGSLSPVKAGGDQTEGLV